MVRTPIFDPNRLQLPQQTMGAILLRLQNLTHNISRISKENSRIKDSTTFLQIFLRFKGVVCFSSRFCVGFVKETRLKSDSSWLERSWWWLLHSFSLQNIFSSLYPRFLKCCFILILFSLDLISSFLHGLISRNHKNCVMTMLQCTKVQLQIHSRYGMNLFN